MMLFSELYGSYYNTLADILKTAAGHPVDGDELRHIIEKNAFGESILNIFPALTENRWQLLSDEGSSVLHNSPTIPMTLLEKRWLKAISLDPRIKLFDVSFPELTDVEPLFTEEDYFVFDKYSDGDPYEDEAYIINFRMIRNAIKNGYPLSIDTVNRRNGITHLLIRPEYLEYSEKDDKFRVIGSGSRYGKTVNLGRIVSCKPYYKPFYTGTEPPRKACPETVVLEITDKRNALERVLLHFAHFEKEAERLDDGRYRVKIVYDKDDEIELVIRVLSFGPLVKVVSPQSFVELIKQRLISQKSCE